MSAVSNIVRAASAFINRPLRGLGYQLRLLPTPDPALSLYRELYPEASVTGRRFYNIGAGSFRHPAWTNVDHPSDWYGQHGFDLAFDLLALEPLPMADDSAEVLYCSHVIEHATDEAIANLFREAVRVLKPGGVFRVTAPNIDLDYHAYQCGDRSFFYWTKYYSVPAHYRAARYAMPLDQASVQQLFLSHFAAGASKLHADGAPSPMTDEEIDRVFSEMAYEDALDYCVSRSSLDVQRKYPGNHINWWNPSKLERELETAGFSEVIHSAFGQSLCPVLRNTDFFDNTHPKLSLYVDAIKQP